jgi:hypothetical protein
LLLVAAVVGRVPARALAFAKFADERTDQAFNTARVVLTAPRPPPSSLSLVFG